jgi:hypothetical protein
MCFALEEWAYEPSRGFEPPADRIMLVLQLARPWSVHKPSRCSFAASKARSARFGGHETRICKQYRHIVPFLEVCALKLQFWQRLVAPTGVAGPSCL